MGFSEGFLLLRVTCPPANRGSALLRALPCSFHDEALSSKRKEERGLSSKMAPSAAKLFQVRLHGIPGWTKSRLHLPLPSPLLSTQPNGQGPSHPHRGFHPDPAGRRGPILSSNPTEPHPTAPQRSKQNVRVPSGHPCRPLTGRLSSLLILSSHARHGGHQGPEVPLTWALAR